MTSSYIMSSGHDVNLCNLKMSWSCVSHGQCSKIKIEAQHKKSASEIFNALKEAYGTSAPSYSQVAR